MKWITEILLVAMLFLKHVVCTLWVTVVFSFLMQTVVAAAAPSSTALVHIPVGWPNGNQASLSESKPNMCLGTLLYVSSTTAFYKYE